MADRERYEILSYEDVEQRQKWQALCQRFDDIDIYYLPEYAYLFELKGDGKAHCFVYYDGPDHIVLYPFLRRNINELPAFADLPGDLTDITSSYGYGGYLRNSQQIDMYRFISLFHQYCQENNIISEFVRFHPFLENHAYCEKSVSPQLWNEIVYFDLNNSEEDIWKAIARTARQGINKAVAANITLSYDPDFEHMDRFCDLYTETMNKVGADNYYFFSQSWFENMVKLLKDHMALFHAIQEGEIIGSMINFHCGDYICIFLAGSNPEKLHLRPNNFLYFKSALWAKAMGFKKYLLGGGLKPNDSLFKFKTLFSPLRAPFYLGKVIHNPEQYQYLCNRKLEGSLTDSNPNGFFPLYRK